MFVAPRGGLADRFRGMVQLFYYTLVTICPVSAGNLLHSTPAVEVPNNLLKTLTLTLITLTLTLTLMGVFRQMYN